MVKIILQKNLSEWEGVSEMADVEEVAMLPPQTDQEEDAGGQRENNSKESKEAKKAFIIPQVSNKELIGIPRASASCSRDVSFRCIFEATIRQAPNKRKTVSELQYTCNSLATLSRYTNAMIRVRLRNSNFDDNNFSIKFSTASKAVSDPDTLSALVSIEPLSDELSRLSIRTPPRFLKLICTTLLDLSKTLPDSLSFSLHT